MSPRFRRLVVDGWPFGMGFATAAAMVGVDSEADAWAVLALFAAIVAAIAYALAPSGRR